MKWPSHFNHTDSGCFENSYNLFPFVFWVSLSFSVVLRLALWNYFAPSSVVGKSVRVFERIEKIEERKVFGRSTFTMIGQNIRIETTGVDGIFEQSDIDVLGRDIEVVGILDYRLPNKKIPDFIVYNATVVSISTQRGIVQEWYKRMTDIASSVHHLFVETLGNYFSQDELSLFIGMLLGTKENLSSSLYQQLQASGLLHLVAASGYNIMMVISVSSIFIGILFPRYISIPIILFIVILYVFVSGMQASVIRAALMGSVAYLSHQFLGSGVAAKRVFVFIALCMLIINPGWMWDVGYQLSVAATAGLLWLARPIGQMKLIWRIGQIPGFPESLAASFSTLPVLVFHFGWDRVGWAGIVVNVIAGLLVGPIMAVGAGSVLVGSIWPFGGKIIAVLGRPVMAGLIKTIELGAWMNGLLKGVER